MFPRYAPHLISFIIPGIKYDVPEACRQPRSMRGQTLWGLFTETIIIADLEPLYGTCTIRFAPFMIFHKESHFNSAKFEAFHISFKSVGFKVFWAILVADFFKDFIEHYIRLYDLILLRTAPLFALLKESAES